MVFEMVFCYVGYEKVRVIIDNLITAMLVIMTVIKNKEFLL